MDLLSLVAACCCLASMSCSLVCDEPQYIDSGTPGDPIAQSYFSYMPFPGLLPLMLPFANHIAPGDHELPY
jgi:hypothetical protein